MHKHLGIYQLFNSLLSLLSIDITFGLAAFIVLRNITINLLSSNLNFSFNFWYDSMLSYITKQAKYFLVYIALYN